MGGEPVLPRERSFFTVVNKQYFSSWPSILSKVLSRQLARSMIPKKAFSRRDAEAAEEEVVDARVRKEGEGVEFISPRIARRPRIE